MVSRRPYCGISRRLILAFDVGTEFSSISYCILEPGQIPEIRGVMKFPYQELISGAFKVPSVIWYDCDGDICAIGAGAIRDGVEQEAEDGQWIRVERFNLDTCLQPAGKTLVDVWADFFGYLYHSSRHYIEEQHPSGNHLWASMKSDMVFVLSHPNDWEGSRRDQLKEAAILAGLVSNTEEGRSRIHLVSEGEAGLHFCINQSLIDITDGAETGRRVLVVDASDDAINISSFLNMQEFCQEITVPQSKPQGSSFVTECARRYIKEHLRDSPFVGDVLEIVRCFDKTKLRFRRIQDPAFIKFGSSRDNDRRHDVRSGQLKLNGDVIATFFQPSVDSIVETILEHHSEHDINTVLLIGSLSYSDYLFASVRAAVLGKGIGIGRLDSHASKAVAGGAVSYYLDHVRAVRFNYGIRTNVQYDMRRVDHVKRQNNIYVDLDGKKKIPNGFQVVLPKNTSVNGHNTKEYSYSLWQLDERRDGFHSASIEVLRYSGALQKPEWIDEDPGNFDVVCTVKAEASIFGATLAAGMYFKLDYGLVISLGVAEFMAQFFWTEDGVEKRGPSRLIYGDA